jgi:signal peptidase I
MSIWSIIKKITKVVLCLILVVAVIRLSFFDVFIVPSDSMKNALNVNDLIITNKTLYSGTFKNVLQKLGMNAQPQVNDILVFTTAETESTYYVKRCVGLPGKTIQLKNGVIYSNNAVIQDLVSTQHSYKLWYSNYQLLKSTLNRYKSDKIEYQRLPKHVLITLDKAQKQLLLGKPGVDSITMVGVNSKFNDKTDRFAFGDTVIQNFKSFMIPFAGMRIKINSNTLTTYKSVLETHEGIKLREENGIFYVNGMKKKFYVFKNDYFFMMGDNREKSHDSRYFGVVTKDCLAGKVIFKI